MKKQSKLKIAVIAAAVCVSGAVTVYAAYDSTKDPIVSLSYLEEVYGPSLEESLEITLGTLVSQAESDLSQKVEDAAGELSSQIVSDIDTAKAELSEEIKEQVASATENISAEVYAALAASIAGDFTEEIAALQSQVDALTNVYEVLSLEKGARIIADASCEIVLVSGTASIKCLDINSGIIDCTDGIILFEGESVPLYHKLLIPESGDGRGILINGAAQVLVKGGYTLG